ncbi:biopolymer transporter ExbD [Pseudooceanicola nanhaiensis]|uniref:ExbD/TolR family protein n=1 Tax=Pseudooceanicola nanhaiensis TaxID=375761 RepID=UPI00296F2054|nr:biopolymer transporter ExbD [Pseudooceanicola nanhaiensis]
MSLNFAPPPKKDRGESIVPMINVVFLLLIFFLMTSRLAPPEPIEVAPPVATSGEEAENAPVLFYSAEGEIAFEDLRGEAAIAAMAAAADAAGPDAPAPQLRADQGAEAAAVARLLKDLAAAGLSNVSLVIAPQ